MAHVARRPLLIVALVLIAVGSLAAVSRSTPRALVGTVGAPTPLDPTPGAVPDADPGTVPTTATATVPATSSTMVGHPAVRGDAHEMTTTTGAVPELTTTTVPAEASADDPNGPDVVRGRVTDQAGRPVAGLCFQSQAPELTRPQILARSAADGTYRIEGGFWSVRTLNCEQDGPFGYEEISILRTNLAPGTVTHDLTVPQLGAVRGRVVDRQGNPIAGVLVHVSMGAATELATGPDGTFTSEHVLQGRSVTWAYDDVDLAPMNPQQGPDVVVAPGRWTDVTLVLAPWTPYHQY